MKRSAALALFLGVLAAAAAAQPHVYGLNEKGRLSINGTTLDTLTGGYDPPDEPDASKAWLDLASFTPSLSLVSDRYALRADGRIYKNGMLFYTLPYSVMMTSDYWVGMAVTPTAVYAIRQGGDVATNGIVAVTPFPTPGLFTLTRVVGLDPNFYTLRSDGAVFENTSTTIKFQFVGGAGPGGSSTDGMSFNTVWTGLAIDPAGAEVIAVRRDGKIFSGTLPGGAMAGTMLGPLPTPTGAVLADGGYADVAFTNDGLFHVLRADGEVYDETNLNVFAYDFPGDGSDPTGDDIYLDFAPDPTVASADFWVSRWDGMVFKSTDEVNPALDLASNRYRRLAITNDPPDLTNFENPYPVAAVYRTTAIEGTAVSIPIVATDVETRATDLSVMVTMLPVGATYMSATPSPGDTLLGTVDWTPPLGSLGSYYFMVSLDDGVNLPRLFKYTIKVRAADADQLKNFRPYVAKIKRPQAVVVGFSPMETLQLPIYAADADGDAVTITVDPLTPLPTGATFLGGVLEWAPDATQVGKWKIRFLASDGIATSKLNLKITVINSLIFS